MVPLITATDSAIDLPTLVPPASRRDVEQEALAVQFKLAMRRQAAHIAILAAGSEASRAGMIATAVISVSMSPASLLISVNRSASLHPILTSTRQFSVNFLAAEHELLVPVFSGTVKGGARFSYGNWKDVSGVPVLNHAYSSMICEVDATLVYGSHQLFIGLVKSVAMRENATPLFWADGACTMLSKDSSVSLKKGRILP